jgi:hypothetical protein
MIKVDWLVELLANLHSTSSSNRSHSNLSRCRNDTAWLPAIAPVLVLAGQY